MRSAALLTSSGISLNSKDEVHFFQSRRTDFVLYLNVKTVPAFDTEFLQEHTAFTVFHYNGKNLQTASGWTLKDAIELFSKLYSYHREDLGVKRPFASQH